MDATVAHSVPLHVTVGGLIANIDANIVLVVTTAWKPVVAFALFGERGSHKEERGENQGEYDIHGWLAVTLDLFEYGNAWCVCT
jgi:hypothetical protein